MCNRPPVSTHKAFPCCGRCTRSHLSIVGVLHNWSDGLQVFTQISPNAVNFMVWQFKTCFSRLVSLPDCSKCSLFKVFDRNLWRFCHCPNKQILQLRPKRWFLLPPCAICATCASLCYQSQFCTLWQSHYCNALQWKQWNGLEAFCHFNKNVFLTPSWRSCCSDLWVAPWAPRRRREQRSGRCPPSAIAPQHTRGWLG